MYVTVENRRMLLNKIYYYLFIYYLLIINYLFIINI